MRKIVSLFIIAAALCSCGTASKTSGNPLFEGKYADPEAVIWGKEYYIFPTSSLKYEKQVYFDCFSSKDLITWEKHSHILDTAAVKWAHKAMWAPSIVKKDDGYYFFFGANDVHKGEEGGIGVAYSKTPDGPYKDYLGRPLIADEIINGAQPIDQFVFNDDGQWYMVYGGWGHCNIVKLKEDFTGFIPYEDGTVFKEITPKGYVEGPFMFKRNGKYYFLWSEGGWTGPDYCVAYAIADSPLGPFVREGKILQSDGIIATGAGHNSVIHDQKHDLWYMVYHRHPVPAENGNDRVVCIDRMEFDRDGHILPVKITNEGVTRKKL